jgi:hypothetical protein
MHAVIIEVTIDDQGAARAALDGQLIPMLKGIPDFVGGHWVALSEGRGVSIVVFESEASAKALASQAGSMPMANVTTQRIEVGEVMASA